MDETTRVAVFIDGSNFYNRIKEAGFFRDKKALDYAKLINRLRRGGNVVLARYYIGIIRDFENTEKGGKAVKSQQKFLERVRQSGITVVPGRTMYHDCVVREKGVDVKLAVDLVIEAADDHFDHAVLVSSDTDLLPAVQYIRSKGKRIEYVGFSHKPSIALVTGCDEVTLLKGEDLDAFAVTELTQH